MRRRMDRCGERVEAPRRFPLEALQRAVRLRVAPTPGRFGDGLRLAGSTTPLAPRGPAVPEPSRAARVTLSCAARGQRASEECHMRRCFLVLFSALALAGCISFSSSNPNPPPSTVVVPAR